jgi:hypothetical protein
MRDELEKGGIEHRARERPDNDVVHFHAEAAVNAPFCCSSTTTKISGLRNLFLFLVHLRLAILGMLEGTLPAAGASEKDDVHAATTRPVQLYDPSKETRWTRLGLSWESFKAAPGSTGYVRVWAVRGQTLSSAPRRMQAIADSSTVV